KEYLKKLNIKAPIHLTTTKVNDQLIDGVPEKSITVIKSILFLARIEKNKGIFISIDAFQILIKKHPELQFQIVGRGNALNEAKEYVKSKSIPNIMFTGPLSGEELTKEFRNAELYILPTTHGEGMPTSVLEAMAFGLPVITRPVGGLVDFFENDKMGYMIESLNAEEYAEKIEILITNVEKARQISSNNAKYAREHFMASTVAKHLEDKLSEL
ncbi:MAG: glycosyltransferase family 4 protein, partial [Bacteroidales bacterium]